MAGKYVRGRTARGVRGECVGNEGWVRGEGVSGAGVC